MTNSIDIATNSLLEIAMIIAAMLGAERTLKPTKYTNTGFHFASETGYFFTLYFREDCHRASCNGGSIKISNANSAEQIANDIKGKLFPGLIAYCAKRAAIKKQQMIKSK